MRTREVYHRDGGRVEIVSKLKGRLRVVTQLICMACILASSMMWQWTPEAYHWVKMAIVAVVLLPFGWGEFGYLIDPKGKIRLRARAFGIPLFQHTADTTRFSSCELVSEGDGELALCFYNAGGGLEFTLSGIPDEQFAIHLANLVPYAQNQQGMAKGHAIKDIRSESKGRSTLFVVIIFLLLFPIAPLLAFLIEPEGLQLMVVLGGGVILVLVLSFWLRKDGGVRAYSPHHDYVDRWDRKGLFGAVDYRHHLGDDPVMEVQRERFDPASLTVLLMPLAQAVLIWFAATLNGSGFSTQPQAVERDGAPKEEPADNPVSANAKAVSAADNEEGVRKGAQLLLEVKRRKEQQQREAAEKAAAQSEPAEP